MRDLANLAAFIAAREAVPFAWGSNDCVTFAAGAVKALTGTDPLGTIGGWSDEKSALRMLKERGGLAEAVSTVLEPIPTAMAMRGDIGLVESAHGSLLMVVEGLTLSGPAPLGLERHLRNCLTRAWSAGQ